MPFRITGVDDVGGDVLLVTATIDPDPDGLYTIESGQHGAGDLTVLREAAEADPVTVTATGWVSATTNWFPPQAYGPDGNQLTSWEDPPGVATSSPRQMDPGELDTYCQALILAAHPDL